MRSVTALYPILPGWVPIHMPCVGYIGKPTIEPITRLLGPDYTISMPVPIIYDKEPGLVGSVFEIRENNGGVHDTTVVARLICDGFVEARFADYGSLYPRLDVVAFDYVQHDAAEPAAIVMETWRFAAITLTEETLTLWPDVQRVRID